MRRGKVLNLESMIDVVDASRVIFSQAVDQDSVNERKEPGQRRATFLVEMDAAMELHKNILRKIQSILVREPFC